MGTRSRGIYKRTLRTSLYALALLVVVAVVAAALLLLQPVRDRVLSFALSKGRASLPGSLVVGHARWQALSRIEVDDVLWIDEGDTLAVVDRFTLSIALRPLASHRLLVRECILLGLEVDVPAIRRRLRAADSGAAAPERDVGGGFLRPGSLPGVPAVAVERLEMDAPRLRLTDERAIESIDVLASIDLFDGRPPSIAVDRLQLTDSAGRFGVDDTRLRVEIDRGVLNGEGRGRVASGLAVSFELFSPSKDAIDLHVALADSGRADAANIELNVTARLARRQFDVSSVDFQGTLHVPARDSLPTIVRARAQKLPHFSTLDVGFSGRYERSADGSSGLGVHVDERPPFGGLDTRLTFHGGAVAVDTLNTRIKDLAVAGTGTLSADGRVDAWLDARGAVNGFALTDSRLRLHAPSLASPPYHLDVSIVAAELHLAAQATVERPGDWLIKLSPLVLTERRVPLRTPKGRFGEIHVGEKGDVRVRRLTIAGGAGRYLLHGSMSRKRRGELHVDCDWSGPPAILLRHLLPDATKRAEVAAAWPDTVRGTIVAIADLSSGGREVSGTFRVSSPGWIDSSVVRVQVSGDDSRIDTAIVALPGLRVLASGGVRDGEWDAEAAVSWDADNIVERIVPAIVGVTGEADVSFSGRREVPRVRASLSAAYDKGGTRVPAIVAHGDWSRDHLSLRVSCPNGISSAAFALDSLAATLDSHQRKPLPARVTMGATGSDLAFTQRLDVSREDGWLFDTDSLMLEMRGERLRASHPFRVRVHPERARVTLEDVELSGSMGTLRAHGFAQPDSSDVEVHVDVELPPKPKSLTLAEELWPGRVTASLAARGTDAVRGSLVVSDFKLGERTALAARINATAAGDSIEGDMVLSDVGGDLASATFQFPGTIDVFPPRARLGDGVVSVLMNLEGFPLPDRRPLPGSDAAREVAHLDGRLWIGGTSARPEAGAGVSVSFPAGSPLASYRVDLAAHLSAWALPGEVPRSVRSNNMSALLAKLDPAQGVGFVADARVFERGKPVADGVVRLPVVWSLSPPTAALAARSPVVMRCSSGGLGLAGLAPLLPEDVGIEGRLEFDLALEGPVAEAALSGRVTGRELKFTHANGTRVAGMGELRLAGTSKSPSIEGEIQIANSVITVPEKPKNLHPSEGESILWRTMAAGREESGQSAAPKDSTVAKAPVPRINLNVSLVIPSALWIRGKGLDVELAGNLTLTQKGDVPTVTGELNAIRGQLLFLGRTFKISRGKAVFYGEDNINPSLDLELTTTVEGMVITVRMLGTTEEPEVTLSSEPAMSEGDIMSFLVFGKRMEELNSDQVGLVQQRAAQTAATFGTQLASRLSRQMHVDLITLSRGEATGRSTLTLGKYVTRRALLKYEQSLEERAAFLVDLEYFLTRTLRLETFIGQQQQSGLEVNWTRDY
ncbi:MAG: translocation/assembly module TamB [Candidatus Krumholzibacteria bacterium]|nr:translocation/assembly module TamB [Candidatus Krumholzibacteria bacterium]